MRADILPFEQLIREKTGLSIKKDAEERFLNKLNERIVEKNAKTFSNYFNILKNNSEEFYHVINMLTINETYFFREPLHIALFSQEIVPEILQSKSHDVPVKIFSAGCSTGEEAYSLAMSLFEKYGLGLNKKRFSILGVDIDQDAVEKAKQGIYTGRSFRSLSPYLKEKYFEHLGGQRYAIRKHIKDITNFYFLNLMDMPYPNYLKDMDIIFYRNVSIYFDSDVQRKIFENLSHILNDDGYIFLGSAETLSHTFDFLSLVEKNGVFLYHKNKKFQKIQPEPKQSYMVMSKVCLSIETDENKSEQSCCFDDALTLVKTKSYDKAIDILDKLIKHDTNEIKAYSLKASILINLQRLEEAKGLCLKIIEKDSLSADGYFLSGLIAKLEYQHEDAIKRFKETVYLKPYSWIAHFYLAQEYQNIGENTAAHREYGIVLKLSEKKLFKNHGMVFLSLSIEEDHIIRLCRHNMDKLKRSSCGIR